MIWDWLPLYFMFPFTHVLCCLIISFGVNFFKICLYHPTPCSRFKDILTSYKQKPVLFSILYNFSKHPENAIFFPVKNIKSLKSLAYYL